MIDTRPKPLVPTLRADGTIVGPGPVVIDGVVAGGSTGGGSTPGHTESHQVTTTQVVTATDARAHAGDPNLVNQDGGYALQSTTTQSTYVPGTYNACADDLRAETNDLSGAEFVVEERWSWRADDADGSAEVGVQRWREGATDACGDSHARNLRGFDWV